MKQQMLAMGFSQLKNKSIPDLENWCAKDFIWNTIYTYNKLKSGKNTSDGEEIDLCSVVLPLTIPCITKAAKSIDINSKNIEYQSCIELKTLNNALEEVLNVDINSMVSDDVAFINDVGIDQIEKWFRNFYGHLELYIVRIGNQEYYFYTMHE